MNCGLWLRQLPWQTQYSSVFRVMFKAVHSQTATRELATSLTIEPYHGLLNMIKVGNSKRDSMLLCQEYHPDQILAK